MPHITSLWIQCSIRHTHQAVLCSPQRPAPHRQPSPAVVRAEALLHDLHALAGLSTSTPGPHSPPPGQPRRGFYTLRQGCNPPTRQPSPPLPLARYAVSRLWVMHSAGSGCTFHSERAGGSRSQFPGAPLHPGPLPLEAMHYPHVTLR